MMLTFWRRYRVDCLICIFSGTVKVSAVPRREVDLVNGICTSGGKKRVATLGSKALTLWSGQSFDCNGVG